MKFGKLLIPVYLFFGIVALSLVSCDVIEEPIKSGGTPPTGGGDTVYRNVLIEDFTGHRCKNCPKASKTIDDLITLYGDRLVAIGIHSGPSEFTAPSLPDYPSDFRTSDGDAIAAFFGGVPAQPIGMVSRLGYTGSGVGHFKTYPSWPSEANNIINEPAIASIEVTSVVVNTNIQTDVKVTFLGEQNGTYLVATYLKEKSIIAPQLLPDDSRDPNYTHKNVFRTAISAPMGEALASGAITDSTEITKTYTTPLDNAWDENNLEVVCLVYDDSNKEVMQVVQADVQ